MTPMWRATGTLGLVQVAAAAATAGVAAHAFDQARGINSPAVFVLSCVAAFAAYLVVGVLAAIAGRS